MMYDPEIVRPMREELTELGAVELMTPADVDQWMQQQHGSAVLVVNSICGCAAGMARPGFRMALQMGKRPQQIATVFAGQDREATQRVRGYWPDVPPSSPSFALLKDGKLVGFLPRHRIEGRTADQVASELAAMFDEKF